MITKTDNVTCAACGQKHVPDGETFFTFYGNVTLGTDEGLIGNNFSDDGKLAGVTFFCTKKKCLNKSLLQYFDED